MSSTPLGEMIVKLGVDDAQFTKGMTGIKQELRSLDSQFKTAQTGVNGFGTKMTGLARPSDILNQSIKKQVDYLNKLKESYKGSFNEEGKATTQTGKYAAQISDAQTKLASYVSRMKDVVKQQSLASSSMYQLGERAKGVGSSLQSAGNAAMPASLYMQAAFVKGIQAATSFQQQMTSIRALLADDTPANKLNSQMAQMEAKSKEWATQYGIATESVNDGMEEMVKKGYTFNQTMGAMPAVLNASKASGEDFNTVMSTSTSILEQFNLKSNNTAKMTANTSRVTDALSFVANKTAAGFKDMGDAMTYIGPVAHGAGMSIEETSAAIGLMSNNGLEGEQAGTGLRSVLNSLLNPSKNAGGAMKELGINLAEFKKGQIGLPEIIDKVKESTKGMTDAQRSSLISQAFGIKGQTAMNILVSQGGDKLKDLTSQTKNASGYTKKLADEMNNSASNSFAKAKAQIEVLAINLGEKLLPAIVPLIKSASDLANSFSKWPKAAQSFVVGAGLAVAAAYPLLNMAGNVTNVFGHLLQVVPKVSATFEGMSAARTLTKDLSGMTTAAEGAGSAIGEGAGLAGTLSGALPLALGVAGVAIAGFTIWKLTEGFRENASEVSQWGAAVGEKTSGKLDTLNQKFVDVRTSMQEFDVIGTPAVNDVKNAISGLGKVATDSINATEQAFLKGAQAAGLTQDEINKTKAGLEQQKANVKSMTDQVTAIYQKAADDNRTITASEREQVLNDQKAMIQETVANYGITGNKAKAVMQVFNGDLNNMNEKAMQQAQKSLETMMKKENESYKSASKALKTEKEATNESASVYNKKREALEQKHNDTMNQYEKDYYDTALAEQEKYHKMDDLKNTSAQSQFETKMRASFKKMGLDYDQFIDKMGKSTDKSAKKMGDTGNLIAQYTSKMSADSKKANDTWNAMIFDPKTGKIKTNAVETLSEATKTEQGWNNAMYIAKNANLSTNARLTMAEALSANGQWNNMTPKEKKLVVDNHAGMQAIFDSKTNLSTWNSMPEKVKKMLGNNSDFINNKNVATATLQSWDALSPKEKKLTAKNMTKDGVDKAMSEINKLPPSKQTELVTKHTNIFETIYKKITGHALGTSGHAGGLAMVNDQAGSLYKELITLPSGQSFIPQGRNIILDLPQGSKVLKASKTAQMIPKYASGIGAIPSNAKVFQEMDRVQEQSTTNDNTDSQLSQIIQLLKSLSDQDNSDLLKTLKEVASRPVLNYIDKKSLANELAQPISVVQANTIKRMNLMNGVRS